ICPNHSIKRATAPENVVIWTGYFGEQISDRECVRKGVDWDSILQSTVNIGIGIKDINELVGSSAERTVSLRVSADVIGHISPFVVAQILIVSLAAGKAPCSNGRERVGALPMPEYFSSVIVKNLQAFGRSIRGRVAL